MWLFDFSGLQKCGNNDRCLDLSESSRIHCDKEMIRMTAVAPSGVRAPRNRTVTLSREDRSRLQGTLLTTVPSSRLALPLTGVVMGDFRVWIKSLPEKHVDLLFLDPPYNLDKSFNGNRFSRQDVEDYSHWLDEVIVALKPVLKRTATIYICGDWFTSLSIFQIASRHF